MAYNYTFVDVINVSFFVLKDVLQYARPEIAWISPFLRPKTAARAVSRPSVSYNGNKHIFIIRNMIPY